MNALCNVTPYLFIVLFFISLYLSLSISVPNLNLVPIPWLYVFLLTSKHVYSSLYSIRIASLQGNHGYFLQRYKQKQKTR